MGANIYVFNNRARFISKIKPTLDHLYTGLYTKKIVKYRIAAVIIDYLEGKRQILLIGAAFILSFYTNLVCI